MSTDAKSIPTGNVLQTAPSYLGAADSKKYPTPRPPVIPAPPNGTPSSLARKTSTLQSTDTTPAAGSAATTQPGDTPRGPSTAPTTAPSEPTQAGAYPWSEEQAVELFELTHGDSTELLALLLSSGGLREPTVWEAIQPFISKGGLISPRIFNGLVKAMPKEIVSQAAAFAVAAADKLQRCLYSFRGCEVKRRRRPLDNGTPHNAAGDIRVTTRNGDDVIVGLLSSTPDSLGAEDLRGRALMMDYRLWDSNNFDLKTTVPELGLAWRALGTKEVTGTKVLSRRGLLEAALQTGLLDFTRSELRAMNLITPGGERLSGALPKDSFIDAGGTNFVLDTRKKVTVEAFVVLACFTKADEGKLLVVLGKSLSVGGTPRGALWKGRQPDIEGTIRRVEEKIGGNVRVELAQVSKGTDEEEGSFIELKNPVAASEQGKPMRLTDENGKEELLELTFSHEAKTTIVPGAQVRLLPTEEHCEPCCFVVTKHIKRGLMECVVDNASSERQADLPNAQKLHGKEGRLELKYSEEDFPHLQPGTQGCHLQMIAKWTGQRAGETTSSRVSVVLAPPPLRMGQGDKILFVSYEGHLVDATIAQGASDESRPSRYNLHVTSKSETGRDQAVEQDAPTEQVDLNGLNYCWQSFDNARTYRRTIAEYCKYLAECTRELEDAITGMRLQTEEQLMSIAVRQKSSSWLLATSNSSRRGVADIATSATSSPSKISPIDVKCIKDLAKLQLARAPKRHMGCFPSQPMLVCAGSGVGKSWSAIQLAHELAKRCNHQANRPAADHLPFVPLLVVVQRLVRLIHSDAPLQPTILLRYFAREYAKHPERDRWLMMIAQAFQMRTLIVVLDGIDEAARLAPAMSTFVREVLVNHNFRFICTSRPDSMVIDEFTSLAVVFDIIPLSEAQQQAVMERQLTTLPAGLELWQHLSSLLEIRKTQDEIYENEAFLEQHQAHIESFAVVDQLQLRKGGNDPAMRQHCTDGKSFVKRSRLANVRSKYLQRLQSFFTNSVLNHIDTGIYEWNTKQTTGNALEAMQSVVLNLPHPDVVQLISRALPNDNGADSPSESNLFEKFGKGHLSEEVRALLQHSETFAQLNLAVKLALLVLDRQKLLGSTAPRASDYDVAVVLTAAASAGNDKAVQRIKYLHDWVPSTQAYSLWPDVLARTDELYLATEGFSATFRAVIEALGSRHGLHHMSSQQGGSRARWADLRQISSRPAELQRPNISFGVLKDPVRIHEKSIDEHLPSFQDWDDATVIPESCMIDVLRARVIFSDDKAIMGFNEELRRGFETRVDRGVVRVKLVRCENNFSKVGPTHFRSLLNTLQLTSGDRSCYAEVEVHHNMILTYNEESHARVHYDYFRSLMPERTFSHVDETLEKSLMFLQEVSTVPTLLAMLVIIFMHRAIGDRRPLPSDRIGMYYEALKHCTSTPVGQLSDSGAILPMLKAVAAANQIKAIRQFTMEDVKGALTSNEVHLWHDLARAGAIPSVKVLEQGFSDHANVYQFCHISFQEALATLDVMSAAVQCSVGATGPRQEESNVADEKRGPALPHPSPNRPRSPRPLSPTQQRAPNGLSRRQSKEKGGANQATGAATVQAPGFQVATQLHRSFMGYIEAHGLNSTLANLVNQGFNRNLVHIGAGRLGTLLGRLGSTWDLRCKHLTGESCQALAQLLPGNASLKSLNLEGNQIGLLGTESIAAKLSANSCMLTLNLSRNTLGKEEASALVRGLRTGSSITHLNLSNNRLCAEGAQAFAVALLTSTRLIHLNLSANALCHDAQNQHTTAGVCALAEAIEANGACSLRQLDVSCNMLCGQSPSGDGSGYVLEGVQAARAIARSLCTRLMRDLPDECQLQDGPEPHVSSVSDGGAGGAMLRSHLNLAENMIGTKGSRAIADVLCAHGSLTDLSLHLNLIGVEGCEAISDALRTNATLVSTLATLTLGSNQIKDAGTIALATALQSVGSRSVLIKLDLSRNGIGSQGASALALYLRSSVTIQELDISRNQLLHGRTSEEEDEAGISALAEALRDVPPQTVSSRLRGSAAAASNTNMSALRYVDMSYNDLNAGSQLVLQCAADVRSKVQRRAGFSFDLNLQYND